MKVSTEKIKARGAQFQKEGLRVRATLELNAGIKEPPFRSDVKISKSLMLASKSREDVKTAS